MDRSEEACREEGFSRMKSQNQKSFAKNESSASVRHVPIKKSGSDFPQDSFMSSGWERFDKACRQMDEELRNTWDMDMKDSMDDKFFKPTKRYSPHLMETVTKKSETKRSFIREETRFSSTDNLVDKKDDFLPLDDKNLMTNIREDSKVFELTMDVRNFGKDQLKITIYNNMLRIEGQRETKAAGKSVMEHVIRKFTIPESCITDKITSELSKDGYLLISVPKDPSFLIHRGRIVPITIK